MTHIWQRTADGYERPGFRVRPLAGGSRYHWQLDVSAEQPDGSTTWHAASYHRRLRTAQMQAVGIERERLNHGRIMWRVMVGGFLLAASLLGMAFAPSLGVFVVSIVCFGLAVRFGMEALAIRAGDDTLNGSWPHLEQAALRLMDSFRRSDAPSEPGPVSPIRALAPNLETPEDEGEGPVHHHASPMHVC